MLFAVSGLSAEYIDILKRSPDQSRILLRIQNNDLTQKHGASNEHFTCRATVPLAYSKAVIAGKQYRLEPETCHATTHILLQRGCTESSSKKMACLLPSGIFHQNATSEDNELSQSAATTDDEVASSDTSTNNEICLATVVPYVNKLYPAPSDLPAAHRLINETKKRCLRCKKLSDFQGRPSANDTLDYICRSYFSRTRSSRHINYQCFQRIV